MGKLNTLRSPRLLVTVGVVVLTGIGALALAGSLGYEPLAGRLIGPRATPTAGTIIVSTGHTVAPPPVESARRADLVAVATITDRLDPFWPTPDGKRPQLSDREIMLRTEAAIFTPQVLRIHDVIKGDASVDPRIVINRLGGRVGDDEFVEEWDPYVGLELHTRFVVFLRDCGQEKVEELGGFEGFRYRTVDLYAIGDDGMASGIGGKMPLDELITLVETQGYDDPRREMPC